jgi:hypothetical protein
MRFMKPIFTSLSAACINLVFVLLSLTIFASNSALLVDDNQYKATSILKEKIYIHFDKTFYEQGENIWYKIYLVDAINHVPETLSKVVYVDLISPTHEIIETKTIKISQGTGKGDFKLMTDLPNGAYTVRAYTNFMRNFDDSYFFTKKILVNTLESNNSVNTDYVKDYLKPTIRFFPEGGNMVPRFLNRIVVKVESPLNNEAVVTGEVVDETNNKVLQFETSTFGLGSFQFIPLKGKTYKVIVYHNGEKYAYPLPQVKDYSASIRIDENHNGYRVSVYSSLANGTNDLELLGIQKGDIVCRAKLNSKNSEVAIDLQKRDLLHGVIQFQLLNKNGTMLSEELAFIDSDNLEKKVAVVPSKKTYQNNEQVELAINFDSLLEEPLEANISVSVTEVNPILKNIPDLDITAQLLLNSEIRDNIEPFGSYFYNDSIRKKNIHQLLISQEGNRHLFNDTIKGNGNTLEFLPESGFNLSGLVKGKNNEKFVKANVALSYKNGKELGYDDTTTDSLGRFSFNNLNFDDRTFIALKAKSLKPKRFDNPFTIELDSAYKTQYAKLGSKIEQDRNTEFAPQDGEIKLDQVKVKVTDEKKHLNKFSKKRRQSLYQSASHTLDFKDSRISKSARNPIQALQGMIPGVEVIQGEILIRGGVNSITLDNKPLYLLNGVPTDFDTIESLPIEDIDFIDILKGPRAMIYGLMSGGLGVIAVYTLDGTEKADKGNARDGTISFYHPGYYQARTFNPNENNSSTLYWNPDIKINSSENTKITFNSANKSATYKVLLEGITSNGMPFKAETYFDVN